MTIDESVENLKIVVEAFERLRVGISPFVQATVTERFSYLPTEILVEQLRKICPHEGADPLPEMPDTFTGMDISDIVKLLRGDKEILDTAKVFKWEFGSRFFDLSRDLRDYRNKAAHHNGLASKQFTLDQVGGVIATAITLLKPIAERHPKAKEQLARLEALQLEYLLRNRVLDDIQDSYQDHADIDPRVQHIRDPERQKARLMELAIRHTELAAAASHREDFDAYQILEQISDDDPAVRQAAEEAHVALREVATAGTVMDLSGVIEREPENAGAYNFRGNIYHHVLKWHEEAKADYGQAIKLNPEDAKNYVNRGDCHFALEAYAEAIADYTEAIKLNDQDANPYRLRGDCHVALEEYAEAIEDYGQAIKLNPEDARNYVNRGYCHYLLEAYAEAIANSDEVIKLNDRDYDAYCLRGDCYYELRQYEKARKDYTAAIKLNPLDAIAYNDRGDCYRALERYREASEDYTEAINLNPQDAAAHYHRGFCYIALQQYEEARKDYTAAIELIPENAILYQNRGFCYRELQQYEKAVGEFTTAIAINPERARLYRLRGAAYELWGDQAEGDEQSELFDRALADFEEADRLEGLQ